VNVTCLREGARWAIRVEDTGHGIARERIEQLFTPFARLGAEQTDVEGTGLGLALVHGIVREHQGDVTIASTPGEGTTFEVDLPRERAAAGTRERRSLAGTKR
jgi:signal transduction histidine kinase